MSKLYRILTPLTVVAMVMMMGSCATSTNSQNAGPAIDQDPDHETIVILGTNDIHGGLAVTTAKTKESAGVTPIEYQRGGGAIFANQLAILRQEFGNRLLWLDAGDHFQGTLESNSFEGASMVRWFNSLGLTAAAIGNHEFDFGPVGADQPEGDQLGALKARTSEAKYPYLSANILEKSTGRRVQWPNVQPSLIVNAGRIKVGIIGLTTLDTPTTTRAEFVKSLAFDELKKHTLQEAQSLRAQGAQMVVAVAHAGLKCKGSSDYGIYAQADPRTACKPDGEAEVIPWIESLPQGTIDGAVSGHSHSIVHHWVNGVPVIQGGARGNYFNLLYLKYDLKTKKIIAEDSRIEGPIAICPKNFENQGDCSGEKPAPKQGRGDLVTPTLHGRRVVASSATEDLLEPYFKQVESLKKRVIAHAAQALAHDFPCDTESQLGALIAQAIQLKAKADIGLVNCGMIRTGFEAGPITYGDLFRAIPFDNAVQVLQLTGREFKLLLQIAESGARGYFPTSGIKLRLTDPNFPAKTQDLDGDSKISAWEANRVQSVEFLNGKRIEDGKMYRLATVDFLVTGGDDLGWIMKQIPKSRVESGFGLVREVAEDYLTQQKTLSPPEPRMSFVKAAPSSSKNSKKKKR